MTDELTQLTEHERHVLEHALGMSGRLPGYRNYYAATPDSEADLTWIALAERGLAEKTQSPSETFPYNCYSVTSQGKTAVGLKD